MHRIDSTVSTIAIAFVAAAAVSALLTWQPNAMTPGALANTSGAQTAASGGEPPKKADPTWAASATGRVEPADGEVRIVSQVGGQIADVLVESNDHALKGDLLVRLDDGDHLARVVSAVAEADVRERERDDEKAAPTAAALDRRKAEDVLDKAERALFAARQAFDMALIKRKSADGNNAADVINLRVAVTEKQNAVADARQKLAVVQARTDLPLVERLEASLTQARADLKLAYQALERTRIRAPANGTVLRLNAKRGELAVPSPEAPLATFGNLTTLKVRAEVEERDINKIRVGQAVVVRADAYPDREFKGTVTSIASALGSAQIASRGPRRPNDVDVLEVIVTLESGNTLVTGLRVDVFFALQDTADGQRK
jgi:HlyD family secretion protein